MIFKWRVVHPFASTTLITTTDLCPSFLSGPLRKPSHHHYCCVISSLQVLIIQYQVQPLILRTNNRKACNIQKIQYSASPQGKSTGFRRVREGKANEGYATATRYIKRYRLQERGLERLNGELELVHLSVRVSTAVTILKYQAVRQCKDPPELSFNQLKHPSVSSNSIRAFQNPSSNSNHSPAPCGPKTTLSSSSPSFSITYYYLFGKGLKKKVSKERRNSNNSSDFFFFYSLFQRLPLPTSILCTAIYSLPSTRFLSGRRITLAHSPPSHDPSSFLTHRELCRSTCPDGVTAGQSPSHHVTVQENSA